MTKISYRSELESGRTHSCSLAPEMSETGLSLYFEPVLCKLKQGFVWGVISSRVGLSSYRSHVMSPLVFKGPFTLRSI